MSFKAVRILRTLYLAVLLIGPNLLFKSAVSPPCGNHVINTKNGAGAGRARIEATLDVFAPTFIKTNASRALSFKKS